MIIIAEDEYIEHCDSDDGLCTQCWEWQCGGVEPDTENYECDACGAMSVMGAEQALICGHIEF